MPVSPGLDEEEIAQFPTQPSPVSLWQYEAVDVATEITASLPLVSDAAAKGRDEEATTLSVQGGKAGEATSSDWRHVELDIAELDTQPPAEEPGVRKTTTLPCEDEDFTHEEQIPPFPAMQANRTPLEMVSWTAGQGANSLFARRVAQRSDRVVSPRTLVFHPFDRVRWWLLYPGRLEFVLWLSGTLCLLMVTCLLLLILILSVIDSNKLSLIAL